MKLQLIYIFYINNSPCNDKIYNLHYYWLNKISNVFDKITFIVLYNKDVNNNVIINVKQRLFNECIKCNNINIILNKNIEKYQEGIYFKKYIIDKLNDYDDYLTFFGHTQGVSNELCKKNELNTLEWIYALYYFNFINLDEIKRKLNSYCYKYITYGGLYLKDYRLNNIYNWIYSGSFYWINTKRLNNYIKNNNININDYLTDENELLKRCSEIFIGSCIDPKYAAFLKDEKINKNAEYFNNYDFNDQYDKIDMIIKFTIMTNEYTKFINEFNNYIN